MLSSAAVAYLVLTAPGPQRPSGELVAIRPDGKPGVMCALKHTSVQADVDGFGAAVTVTQTFTNPSKTPIEAIYTFPLPQDAAVDQMRIQVGNRVVEGEIARREEARRTYEAAKAAGQTAALLDQERPNMFTQSVANILPGAEIKVQIRYVQVVPFTEGQYEFSFPMTVAPRFVNDKTPDPGKVTPPVGTRTGAGIDLTVNLDAGAPITQMTSLLHSIDQRKIDAQRAQVTLAKRDEIPNRDFILRYRAGTDAVQSGVISHFVPGQGGTFALMLMPPKAVPPAQIQPKEMIFVMDQSGSQNGFPIAKSKELTLRLLQKMGPRDTFNVLGFSNEVKPLWREAQANTPKNVAAATAFVKAMQANGGTELEKAVTAALGAPDDPERLRIVVFNTDGMAGQERVILDEVRKHRGNSRMFPFGIGNSVNRYLIEAMATEGRGDMEVVTLAEQADGAVDRLYRRANSPVLTDLTARATGVHEMTPAELPDVFLERPVIVFGQYAQPGASQITVRGTRGDGRPWTQTLNVDLTDKPLAPSIVSLWARRKVDDLMRASHYGPKPLEGEITAEQRVTALALKYRIMSPFTSFVAVEKRVVNVGGKPRTVRVPVEMADGVDMPMDRLYSLRSAYTPAPASAAALPTVRGGFGGVAGAPIKVVRPRGKSNSASLTDRSRDFYANETPEMRYERIVDADLRKATGKVPVQILLTKWDAKVLVALEELGLKIEAKDKGLKALFGTVDAKKLKALAKIAEVTKITAL
jgi:Ca-activated chloride channel family protein